LDRLPRDIIRRMEETSISPEQPVDDADKFVVFKRSHFYSVMVVLSFAVGILVGYMAWGRDGSTQQVASAPGQAQAPGAQAAAENSAFTRYDIPTEGYPSLGPEDAEIVLVEFSDYQ
jgi:hypothetical protein